MTRRPTPSEPRFSERTALSRRPHALARAVEAARRSGRALLDLTPSNPTRVELPPHPDPLEALGRRPPGSYRPAPFGAPAAREAVAALLGCEPHDIVLASSTSEAYAWLFTLLCDPGEEVLVPAPSYPLLEHLARFASVRLMPYRLHWAEGWFVDLESLRRAAGPRTRAVVVVQPNNPTGSYLAPQAWEAIGRLGLPVVADEVFFPYPLTAAAASRPGAATAATARGAPLVFALDGLSKRCGLPQLKAAWIRVAGERRAVQEALERLELVADAFLPVSAPVQAALPELLRAGEARRRAIARRLEANLAALRALRPQAPFDVLAPEGGWYALLRLPATRSEEAWALRLLEAGVLVQPGWYYDADPAMGPLAVLSLLTPPGTWTEGLARLREATRDG